MNDHFRAELTLFVGRQIIDCYDEIAAIAKRHGYYIDALDPEFNSYSIDVEANRLDVVLDGKSVITGFRTG